MDGSSAAPGARDGGARPAPTPTHGGYGEDLFDPGHSGEDERIDYGALAYDEVSRARLRALGVGPGWRCLDVGAGTGTISRWLADEVGVDEVLAVDRDPRFVQARPGGRLRTMTADITDPSLEPGRFDLVHCRFVLMHLPQHAQVLARLAEWVAPGGWLVVGDALDLATADSPHAAYRRTMAAMWQALRARIGTDVTWVTRYPRLLHDLGLAEVGAEVLLPPLTVDAPITAFWKTTWLSMREALLAGGDLEPGELEQALDYLASPALADLSPGMITAWGRRHQA
ncbi:class I SAM-dependent methyltransferase [Actinospica durhamensis]|uniref:Class I SAM-dependent methyltransferase n=1 Tax=Actinospica durhamensis TaxID=1508375 RepID=A0A941EUZ6_9ACTN|nr:class I SAM-dependent methyltransferase [Actinospica durhamensis]MBR7838210.1 class I SAM-dependent methyltransferase [Actinospica durhamensis]